MKQTATANTMMIYRETPLPEIFFIFARVLSRLNRLAESFIYPFSTLILMSLISLTVLKVALKWSQSWPAASALYWYILKSAWLFRFYSSSVSNLVGSGLIDFASLSQTNPLGFVIPFCSLIASQACLISRNLLDASALSAVLSGWFQLASLQKAFFTSEISAFLSTPRMQQGSLKSVANGNLTQPLRLMHFVITTALLIMHLIMMKNHIIQICCFFTSISVFQRGDRDT